jgi:peptide chain release factor 3
VGPLQFEVVQHRLLGEYGAESRLERLPWSIARWIRPKDPNSTAEPHIPLSGVGVATDQDGQKVVLFTDEWVRNDFARRNEAFEMSAIPFADLGIVGAAARVGTTT